MSKKGAVCIAIVVTVAILVSIVISSLVLENEFNERGLTDDEIIKRVEGIEAARAPQELLDYYWEVRFRTFNILPSFIPDTPLLGNNLLIRYINYAEDLVNHDVGGGGKCSEEARDYLYHEALIPIAQAVEVDLNSENDEDRLILAKAIYYWVKDGIEFTSFEGSRRIVKAVLLILPGLLYPFDSRIPWNLSWLASRDIEVGDMIPVPFLMKSPVETASYGHSTCQGQTLLLAALLKLAGFKVSMGFISLQLLYSMASGLMGIVDALWPFGTFAEFLEISMFQHMYVMLKDPGWEVGNWVASDHFEIVRDDKGNIIKGYMPPRDVRGEPIDGTWILLDPTYSASNKKHVPLGFSDNFPAWVGPNPNLLKFAVLD